MSVVLMALAVFGGVDEAASQRQYRIEVVVCEGDPLGNRADGNVKHLTESTVVATAGKPAFFRAGSEVEFTAGGKRHRIPVGITAEVTALPQAGGRVWVDVHVDNTRRCDGLGLAGRPGFTQSSVRMTRLTDPGKTFRMRIDADAPESQTWAEVTVTEVKP